MRSGHEEDRGVRLADVRLEARAPEPGGGAGAADTARERGENERKDGRPAQDAESGHAREDTARLGASDADAPPSRAARPCPGAEPSGQNAGWAAAEDPAEV